jgi:NDP-sugar pyrophosphorylase family protein
MKAMILAAGLGQRMRPLSTLRAKPVLPVLNRPLLHWTLTRLARDGFRDVVINLHYLPASVRDAVGGGEAFGVRVCYSHERKILGSAGGPRSVRHFFGREPFVLVNGDMYFDFDLRALVRRHVRSGARATLALKPNPDPDHYGPVVTARDGRIYSIRQKPDRRSGAVSLFTGVQVLDPTCLDALPPGPSDLVAELYVPLLAQGEKLVGVRVSGPWYDLGDPARYLASHTALLHQNAQGVRRRRLIHRSARVDPSAKIVRSVVGERVVIGAKARVRDSVLWNDVVVGSEAGVKGCIVASGVTMKARRRATGKVILKIGGRQRWARIV